MLKINKNNKNMFELIHDDKTHILISYPIGFVIIGLIILNLLF